VETGAGEPSGLSDRAYCLWAGCGNGAGEPSGLSDWAASATGDPMAYIRGTHRKHTMLQLHFTEQQREGATTRRPPTLGANDVDHWRSVVDNVFVEFLAALFIIMAEIMYADWTDPWTQLLPAIAIAGAMVCLKDGDCFFPDATPTVTLLMWSAGAYDKSWLQPCARITGQCLATGVAIAMCRSVMSEVPPHIYPKRAHGSLFVFEALSTVIEHMGAVYLFIPMLPMVTQGRVRAKHHHETEAPGLQVRGFAFLRRHGLCRPPTYPPQAGGAARGGGVCGDPLGRTTELHGRDESAGDRSARVHRVAWRRGDAAPAVGRVCGRAGGDGVHCELPCAAKAP
jgi:hypothetical protein